MKSELPTISELNAIQNEWMALDSNGPKKEIDRVCKLMEKYPRCYVSGHDGKGVVVYHGTPLDQTMEFELCVSLCRQHGGRVDIAWNGMLGQWYALDGQFEKL